MTDSVKTEDGRTLVKVRLPWTGSEQITGETVWVILRPDHEANEAA